MLTTPPDQDRAQQIEVILRQVDQLPTLSPIAVRLLQIGNVEDADLDGIVEVIESDPALTARLLGLCRRADKGLGDRITTVRRAVVMLGLEAVQAAALSVAVYELMEGCAPALDEQGLGLAQLTPRQREIVRLVGEGKSNAEIAETLGLNEKTITFHRTNIRRALGIPNEWGLVRYAMMARLTR